SPSCARNFLQQNPQVQNVSNPLIKQNPGYPLLRGFVFEQRRGVGARHAAPLHLFMSTLLLVGCSAASDPSPPVPDGHLFTRLPSSYTGVHFENRLSDTRDLNVFTYRNYYNGGDVALGDLTGDGLPEMVLTSNQGATRLYLNA